MAFASAQFIGGAGIVYAFKQVVSEASRVQEETEKTGVVFGRNAAQVQAWSKTLAESFGVSEGAALEASGRFGNMLRPLGFATGAAAAMSEKLVELAADMASFNNTKPDVVLAALSSGLAGQVRPLRQYGVFLSQTRIQQEALSDGIASNAAHLTQAQKVQAAYNIILKDTKLQQGDVARNTGSLSVAMSKFHAGIEDLEAGIGQHLLPDLVKYVNVADVWLNNTKNQRRVQRDVTEAVKDTVGVVKVFAHGVKVAADAVGGFKHLIELLIGLKVARTLLAWRTAMRLFAASAGTAGATGSIVGLLGVIKKLAAISAVSIAIRFPGLAAGLSGLLAVPGAIAAATAAAVLSASGDASNVPGLPKAGKGAIVASLGSHGQIPESVMRAAAKSADISGSMPAGKAFQNDKFVNFLYDWVKKHGLLGTAAGGAGVEAAAKAAAGKSQSAVAAAMAGGGATGVTPAAGLDALSRIQNQVAQARLAAAKGTPGAQSQLVAALKAEIDYDAKYAAIQKRLAGRGGKDAAKHAQTMQRLLADEASAYDEIHSGQTKVESAAKKASNAAAEAAKKRAAARKKALADAAERAQTFTVPMNLLIAQAKAGSTATTKDDVAVALKIKAFAEATIKSNKKKGQALVDAWNEITNQLSVIGTTAKPVSGFRAASLASLTAGLGLSPTARKLAEARLAQAQAHSGFIPTGQGVLGQQITIHINGAGNPDAVAEKVIAKINRGRTQSVTQRRGPNAGYQGRH